VYAPEEMIHIDTCKGKGVYNAKTQFTQKPKGTLKLYIIGAT